MQCKANGMFLIYSEGCEIPNKIWKQLINTVFVTTKSAQYTVLHFRKLLCLLVFILFSSELEFFILHSTDCNV